MYSNFPLKQLSDAEYITKYYNASVAASIASSISAFLPYEANFPGIKIFIQDKPKDTSRSGAPGSINLDVVLNIHSSQSNTNAALTVRLNFPTNYPQQVLRATLLLTDKSSKVKQPYPVMGSDGSVQVECLSFLRGTERPFPIIDVLLALSEQFELEFPLVAANYQAPVSTNDASAVTATLSTTTSSPQRSQLIQVVAEKVVIDLNQKASNYLDTRKQSLEYLKKLNETNRNLTKAQSLLEKHEKELKEYLPSVGSVSTLIQQLEGRQDTPEEHSKCLVPVDALQAQALDLTAQIHASEDALRLLEDGLRSEQLSCDDYVKLVGDVGRDQFVTRFLWRRVMDKLEPAGGASTASMLRPQVPQTRPTGLDALMQEFPNAPSDVVADVLRNANNDVVSARQQMKALFA